MTNFKFKFKYASGALNMSGNGTVQGETLEAATEAARAGVAKDVGGSADNVVITLIAAYTPRKKKTK